MAQVQHLPLYSLAYNFTQELYRIKLKLPKTLKHDLGKNAFESAMKILRCVVLANSAQQKCEYISRLLLEIEVQWVQLRLLFDLRGITEGEFKVLSERLSEIEKQSKGWHKWQQNNQPMKTVLQKNDKNTWQSPEKGIT